MIKTSTTDKTIQLNIAQQAVLTSSEKRILVLAGPGAGKTLVLKEWIKQKLSTDERKSYKILGLTFTNKAANEMSVRLADDIEGYFKRINLMTFHGFGARILRQYGYYLDIPTDFAICNDEDEQVEILKVGLKKAGIREVFNWKNCLKAISAVKKDGNTALSNNQINVIYKAYESELKVSGYLDYDDLLLKSYKLLKKYPALSKHYQKTYSYICIDELQDTNTMQYKILELIINEETNLLTVGDDNQVIYEWNGADYKRLKNFKDKYKPHIIHLPVNYRCPEEIVQVSNKLMTQNKFRLEPFTPNKAYSSKGEVIFKKFDKFKEEILWIAENILEKHQQNLGQVTILARRKKLLDKVTGMFQSKQIAYKLHFRKGEFISAPVAWLNAVLHLFNSPNRKRSMKRVIGTFNQIANLNIDFATIKKGKQKNENTSLFSVWLEEVNQQLNDSGNNFKEIIQLLENQLSIKTYKSFYIKLFNWFDNLEKEKSKETIKKLIYSYDEYKEEKMVWNKLSNEIFERLGSDIPLSTFLQELSLCTKETPAKPEEVNLMTIHAAKGQGFEHVYLIGMVDDELPSYYALKSNKQDAIEEERRNCYVAITRASKTLTITCAKNYSGWAKNPSRFLRDMELI